MYTKAMFTTVLGFVALILLIVITKTYSKNVKNFPIALKIRNLMISGLSAVCANIMIAHAGTNKNALLAYGWYFASIDWISIFLLEFSMEYCYAGKWAKNRWLITICRTVSAFFNPIRKRPNQNKVTKYGLSLTLFFILALIDTVSFLLNIKFMHSFSVYKFIYHPTSESLYQINALIAQGDQIPGLIYNLHLSLCYVIITASLLIIIYKMLTTSSIYRIKFLLVVIMLLSIVFANAIYILTNMPLDYSVASYGLVGIYMYFGAMFYVPRILEKRTMHQVVKNMDNGLIIFDDEGKCTVVNDYCKKILHLTDADDPTIIPMIKRWANISELKQLNQKERYEQIIQRLYEGETYYFKLLFDKIIDSKKNCIGTYFVIMDITEEQTRIHDETFKANHDKLTGIYTKEHFYEMVTETLEENSTDRYLMICSDIGRFKLINDLYGTKVGDGILRRIASELQNRTIAGEVYGRIDNDRFALLMPKDRFKEETFITLPNMIFAPMSELALTPVCYVGVYEIDDPDIHVSVMCDRAFLAMESIKGDYNKRIAWYDNKLRDNMLREQALINQLPDALDSHQIVMFLQPQVSSEGDILGGEALVRWIHPEEGLVSPGEFIPAFEKNGMISLVDQHIWKLACIKLAEWKEVGREDLHISVNISPKDFYFVDIYSVFTNLVRQYNINPKNLKLEITESAVMMDLERQLALLDRLREFGFDVEMDDFGSGYSSLNMLKDINVDVLKIDMAFLQKTKNEERSRKIVNHIITMSKDLGIDIITEGVETAEQVKFLKEAGCKMFQGYYFAKPMEVDKFERTYMWE